LIQGLNLRRLVIVGKALLLGATATALIAAQADTSSAAFDQNVTGFITKNCAGCHNEKLKTAGLALTSYHDTASLLRDRAIWEKAIARVRAGEMPPKGLPRPKPEDIAATTNWIEEQFATADEHPDPGHLTAHRLNRTEYNNTVRDLLGVRFKPAADFPADDSGFGFDNIGDALSVSPVLMEKYLGAAKKIAITAIPLALTAPKPTRERFSPEHGRNEVRLELEHSFDLPAEGDYDLQAAVSGRKEAFHIDLSLDGKPIQSSDVVISKDKPRAYEIHLHVPYGEHVLKAALTPREPSPEEVAVSEQLAAAEQKAMARQIARNPKDEAQIRLQHALGNVPTYVDQLEIRGPFNAQPAPLPASYSRIFICGHPIG
jgi:mono/diheme cytochrome c family protein